jgi:hypothetical protein
LLRQPVRTKAQIAQVQNEQNISCLFWIADIRHLHGFPRVTARVRQNGTFSDPQSNS